MVSPALRGRGAGRALPEEVRRLALAHGFLLLEVCRNRTREASHAFYAACGMKKSHYKFTLPL